ncbi:hypothetical protein NDU88_003961 [Pleurodeles waltl]|uniref:Uncharacterized protein n=1 Tax=Pleurodeles waltl TaxID=8319 RepID=A0AAV7UZX9_PLEWA|nr:hypothetical protein NDU88_003961 [Pleurodeles waltl]
MMSPSRPAPSPSCQPTPRRSSLDSVSAPAPGDAKSHPSLPGPCRYSKSSASMDSLLTPALETHLRSHRKALRLLEEEEYRQLEEGEIEPSDEYQGLATSSGLDTSPEWDITEEATSFHTVVRKAAELLDLPLSVAEVKTNLLTEVLHPSASSADPLLPFNEALTEPILDLCRKPVTTPAVNRAVARRHRGAPGDPVFLPRHTTPESLVVQVCCSAKSAPGTFPGVPTDRESKRMEQSSKKIFSSCSMALKATNSTCVLGRYVHALMDSAKEMAKDLPQEVQRSFGSLLRMHRRLHNKLYSLAWTRLIR